MSALQFKTNSTSFSEHNNFIKFNFKFSSFLDSKHTELEDLKNNVRELNRIANAKKIFSKDTDSSQPKVHLNKKQAPSQNFLSKINKFEELAKSSTKTEPICNAKLITNQLDLTMFQENSIKHHLREVKSKSFGCEKDLHTWSSHQNYTEYKSNITKSTKPKRNKKPKNIIESETAVKAMKQASKPFLIDNINFIDEDDTSSNEPPMVIKKANSEESENEDDFYEDNSDANDALIDDLCNKENGENDTNPEDDDSDTGDDSDSYGAATGCINQDLKCRSAPITPTRMSPTMNMTQNNDFQYNETNMSKMTGCSRNTNTNASFIYNMNLYDDHNRFQLLNEKGMSKLICNYLNRIEIIIRLIDLFVVGNCKVMHVKRILLEHSIRVFNNHLCLTYPFQS